MAFFDTFRQMLGAHRGANESSDDRLRLVEAWGLSDTSHPEFPGAAPVADPAAMAAPNEPALYDRKQWLRRLKRIFNDLPISPDSWADLLADGRALGLEEDWMLRAQLDEFTLLVRRAVADRQVTPDEQRRLEEARNLIGMSDEEAETLLKTVVAEAESFFGGRVEGA